MMVLFKYEMVNLKLLFLELKQYVYWAYEVYICSLPSGFTGFTVKFFHFLVKCESLCVFHLKPLFP